MTGQDGDTHPQHFTDDVSGLALELCLDGTARCLAAPGDLVAPEGEAFYFAAFADAGPFTGEIALEAAFADTTGIVFQRFQYQAEGLTPGDTYTITDPFSTRTCVAEAGRTRCRVDSATPLSGPITQWLIADNAPAGYIGDNATASTVTGSPTGFNKLRVEGPGITSTCNDPVVGVIANCDETDQWIVQGKIAPGTAATLSASSLDFGNTATSTTRNITYSSIGTQPAAVTSATSNNPAFVVNSTGCASVAPGSSCTIGVTYTPVAGEPDTGTLTINDNTAGSGRTVALSGSSLPVTSLSANSLAFGRQKITSGASAARIVTVSNDGAAPLSVSGASTGSSQFQPTNGCSTAVAPGASCDISVAFDPSSTGAKTGTLSITSDGGNRTVSLAGSGTQSAISAASRISHGSTALGRQSGKVLRVTNGGDAAMAISGVSLAGANARDFGMGGSAVNPCRAGLTVPVGGSCRVGVTFRPRALGSRAATLRISADGAQHLVALRGVGVDRTRPGIRSRSPITGATSVRRRANVSVRFAEAVRGVNRSTFTLTNRATGNKVRASVARTGTRFVLNPRANLASGARYTVRLVGGRSAIRDMSNNTLRSTSWGFRTR